MHGEVSFMVQKRGMRTEPLVKQDDGIPASVLIHCPGLFHRSLPLALRSESDASQPMHAQCQRQFAAVMQIMFEQMPDNPLASIPALLPLIALARVRMLKFVLQISSGQTLKRLLDHLPGRLKPGNEFGSKV